MKYIVKLPLLSVSVLPFILFHFSAPESGKGIAEIWGIGFRQESDLDRPVNQKAGLKKNQNAPRPSEHPPVRGEKMSKRLGGIKGCKYKTSSWHLNGFPFGGNIGSTV